VIGSCLVDKITANPKTSCDLFIQIRLQIDVPLKKMVLSEKSKFIDFLFDLTSDHFKRTNCFLFPAK
jgi:hypothetical protein